MLLSPAETTKSLGCLGARSEGMAASADLLVVWSAMCHKAASALLDAEAAPRLRLPNAVGKDQNGSNDHVWPYGSAKWLQLQRKVPETQLIR
eukprot:3986168-Amphidinium_carterae.1